MKEEWETVADYPDYDVSNLGRVRSRRCMAQRGSVTMDGARAVRGMLAAGMSRTDVARSTGLPYYTVKRIANGQTYHDHHGTTLSPVIVPVGKGYLSVTLYGASGTKRELVHRLVAQAFVPNPQGKPAINHKDGNPRNNRADNLEWCTQRENVHHAIRTGLWDQKRASALGVAALRGKRAAV